MHKGVLLSCLLGERRNLEQEKVVRNVGYGPETAISLKGEGWEVIGAGALLPGGLGARNPKLDL